MPFLSNDFEQFIAPQCDRYAFLCGMLKSENIPFSTISLENKRHLYINFPNTAYNPFFRIKTIFVHYDRAPNTPGANDNSAAIFQMLDFIRLLWKSNQTHNIRIFLSDGEELGSVNGISDQGSFTIASRFKKLGITGDDIFVFDGCGRGDILIVSTAGQHIRIAGNPAFSKRFDELQKSAAQLAAQVSPQKWLTLPVPYSDNAGFIASGIPAVAVTLLPQDEASSLLSAIQKNKSLEQDILRHTVQDKTLLPLTWRLMHTPNDNTDTLTTQSFTLMGKFLTALAQAKSIV